MSSLKERFLRYVQVDTGSEHDAECYPSTAKQTAFAHMLAEECRQMGLSDVKVDEHSYVTATVPATCQGAPSIGFVAHMDTSPDYSGANVKPQIVENYDGGIIPLGDSGVALDPEQFPALHSLKGKTLITTDGNTLLGADDKAGIAAILTAAEELLAHPEIPHGKVRIAFTPDEEVGTGVAYFDPVAFDVDFGYTLDGGGVGGIGYECFNAVGAKVDFHGVSIHPGAAKGHMKNALMMAVEFTSLLPADEIPAKTEGYEGYIHLTDMNGGVEFVRQVYILRDFTLEGIERRRQLMRDAAAEIERRYGEGCVDLQLKDTYGNMALKVQERPETMALARKAVESLGVTVTVSPMRGGTDGATLSNMENGFPCPNLFTGGYNGHGRYEFACLEQMELAKETVLRIVRFAAE